ncbi:MAG TPA: IS481 family transposase [Candidatus Eisenbacteria bacterium]|nr:IS481 family transposase [Candidatus Eisenbacteria bacterium]
MLNFGMAWRASSVMDERMRFVLEVEQGEDSMSELCRMYGVSRETGYVWLRRYREAEVEGLRDLGRAPLRHPNQTPEGIEQAVLELRRAHMKWGPRKLKRILEQQQPRQRWPAASTIGEMIAREGLVIARKRRRRVPPYTEPFASADEPNRVWCADFKGWFRSGDGTRIDPLTVSDAHSRYLLRCQAVEKTDTERVQAVFEAAFREYGMPEAIRSDNGAPFASRALCGLSRLSVWWMKLGIRPERIEAGHPEQNGRHERMHRTLKQETAMPPERNRRAQQRAFDRFRQEYNQLRPHEALAMQTPEQVYVASGREFPSRIPTFEYPSAMQVRKVRDRGAICWRGNGHVFLTEVLIGEHVGLLQLDDRYWRVYFMQLPIACLDSYNFRMLPLPKQQTFNREEAGEEGAPPSPAPHPPTVANQKVSGMSPV